MREGFQIVYLEGGEGRGEGNGPDPTCFEFEKTGHFKNDCFILK